jgi:hypothetical protein
MRPMREFVRQRAGSRCEYCHLPDFADEWPFHLEHVVARQHGGQSDPDNLCWSCRRCNLCKGPNLASIDPESGQQIMLFHPRHQNWSDHLEISDFRIVGLTPTGRATVRALQMNENRRVELRRELIAQGAFEL